MAVGKWDNFVTVSCNDTKQINRIAALPFVRSTEKVWASPRKKKISMATTRDSLINNPVSHPDSIYGVAITQIHLSNGDKLHDAGFRGKGMERYRKFLMPDGIVHLKTDSNFMFTYTRYLIEENKLPVEVMTEDLYHSGLADDILNIRTYYEQQWLDRGLNIKYIKFRLPHACGFVESANGIRGKW